MFPRTLFRPVAAPAVSMVLTLTLCCGLAPLALAQSIEPAADPLPSVGAEMTAVLANAARLTTDKQGASPFADGLPASQAGSLQVDLSFEGFGFDDNAAENLGFRFIPPDPIGAAGNSRLIAVVNTMIESRSKGGHLKWRDSLRDFFAPVSPLTFTFDPKITYDPHEDRFVVVTLERVSGTMSMDPNNISRVLVAVSKDGNPRTPTAADWNYLAIDSKVVFFGFDLWADFPGFAVDEEAIYVNANMFTFVPFGFFGGVRLWIIDKGSGTGGFYDGGPASVSTALNPYALAGISTTTQPAKVFGLGGVGGAGSSIGTFLVSYSGLSNGVDEFVQIVRVDDPLGTPSFTQQFLNIGNIEDFPGGLPDAPQAGTAARIEVNDRRTLDCVWRDGALWFTATIQPNSGPDAGETTAHWFKLDTSGAPGPLSLDQQGNIGGEDIAPGTFTFFPSVAVNRDGDAKFGFSASAPTIFAGAFVTGREAGDAPGTVRGSETIKAGEDFYIRTFGGSRNRWGDYSGIAVDPTNDEFCWVFNQFADQRGSPSPNGQDGRWGTSWGRAKFKN